MSLMRIFSPLSNKGDIFQRKEDREQKGKSRLSEEANEITTPIYFQCTKEEFNVKNKTFISYKI